MDQVKLFKRLPSTNFTWYILEYLSSYRNQSMDLYLYDGKVVLYWVNLFHDNVAFLYLLKTSTSLRFSDVFRGYRNETLA